MIQQLYRFLYIITSILVLLFEFLLYYTKSAVYMCGKCIQLYAVGVFLSAAVDELPELLVHLPFQYAFRLSFFAKSFKSVRTALCGCVRDFANTRYS